MYYYAAWHIKFVSPELEPNFVPLEEIFPTTDAAEEKKMIDSNCNAFRLPGPLTKVGVSLSLQSTSIDWDQDSGHT